ncbi:heavy metal translocating P-type ATPase metal-binding domain-containing protein [Ferrovibrio sp.]|uniref:heavy metal translocating P-type ATPase metal-binding domain-containing protein n=1 Tax=Ferrovibrio sp. TaxID=1917215 RepID=UPI003D0EB3DF
MTVSALPSPEICTLPARTGAAAACLHCGAPARAGETFCCTGCSGAYALIKGLGLDQYYRMRSNAAPVGDDGDVQVDWREFVESLPDGAWRLTLLVGDMHCAACLWLIERALRADPAVRRAQLLGVSQRLVLEWRGEAVMANDLAAKLHRLGYRCLPAEAAALDEETAASEKGLLRAMAVAGFAAANIMLFSVSVWSGHFNGMEPATRDLFHAISGVIAIPAIAYAGQPFFRSAWQAVRHGRTNMDVPISIGITLATLVSIAEFIRSGPHAYFDAAITLLFFLLIGRYLDQRARGYARRTAQQLLAFSTRPVAVQTADGVVHRPAQRVACGETVLVAAGERIGVDGEVLSGISTLDNSLLTGESLPLAVAPGGMVHAGAVNIDGPLSLRVTATGPATLIGEMTRLLEAAEQGRSQFVRLAETVSRWYAPVVHLTAILSFIGWMTIGGADWRAALLIAAAVLIITCPCALALAVPVVQVAASSRLMKAGILLKSATALERAAAIDTVVFDKTGTLTLGEPRLLPPDAEGSALLPLAASLAARSRHPLCRALLAACDTYKPSDAAREMPGQGMLLETEAGEYRLGNARFTGQGSDETDGCSSLWFTAPGHAPYRFRFQDDLRPDAGRVIAELQRQGRQVVILSGDHAGSVRRAAEMLGIAEWQAGIDPAGKAAVIAAMKERGRKVLMVGDGLNDTVALAVADASLSPSSALGIAQNVADAVFQGKRLGAVLLFLDVAQACRRLSIQNLALALGYNLFAVPLAIVGLVTPLIAAIAMSSSSLLVVLNALRLGAAVRKEMP